MNGEMQTSGTPIVHIGVGHFARGHWFDLIQQMGMEVTGVQVNSAGDRDKLQVNDFDYDLIVKKPGTEPAIERIAALKDILVAKEDRAKVVRTLADPSTQLVSLTITPKGYAGVSTSDIQREMSRTPNAGYRTIEEPATAAAYIAAALQIRFQNGLEPFSILPLDNHPNSANELRALLIKYATEVSPEFAIWVSNVECLEAMGDRIVSSVEKDPAHVAYLEELAKTQEFLPLPMIVEPMPRFMCLAISPVKSDNPVLKKLLEMDGVVSVEDVEKYELLKTRAVNSAHLAIGVMGRAIGGFDYAHEVMENPVLRKFIEDFTLQMVNSLPDYSRVNKREYARGVIARISNDQLMDPLSRISRNALGKLPNLLLNPLSHLMSSEQPHDRLDVVVAAYIELLKQGAQARVEKLPFDLNDPAAIEADILGLEPKLYDNLKIITAAPVTDKVFGSFNNREQMLDSIHAGRGDLFEIAEQVREGFIPGVSELYSDEVVEKPASSINRPVEPLIGPVVPTLFDSSSTGPLERPFTPAGDRPQLGE